MTCSRGEAAFGANEARRGHRRPALAFYKAGDPCLPGESAHEAFEPHCIQMVWLARGKVGRIVSFLNARLVKAFGFGPRPPLAAI